MRVVNGLVPGRRTAALGGHDVGTVMPTDPADDREQNSSVPTATQACIADFTTSARAAGTRILARSSRRDGYGLAPTAPTRGARCPTAREAGWVAGPTGIPTNGRTSHHQAGCESESRLVSGIRQHQTAWADSETLNHTIFEGTSEIQQLVIARAISGLRIE